MSSNEKTFVVKGTCPNGHEQEFEQVVADYGKWWRVRCETCRIIYSLSKKA